MVGLLEKGKKMWLKIPLFALILLGVGFSGMGVGELMQYSELHQFPKLLVGVGYSLAAVGFWIVLVGRFHTLHQ